MTIPQKFGRPKGSLNKRTLDLTQRLEEKYPGWNPVDAMAALAYDALERVKSRLVVTPDEMQAAIDEFRAGRPKRWNEAIQNIAASEEFALDALREVAQYYEAKRKAIEVSGEVSAGVGGVLVVPPSMTMEEWLAARASPAVPENAPAIQRAYQDHAPMALPWSKP